jgi:hypothetical protein
MYWFNLMRLNRLLYVCNTLSLFYCNTNRYEAQMEKDWQYIIKDSDAKMVIAATEAVYAKCKDYPGKVRNCQIFVLWDCNMYTSFSSLTPCTS